MKLLGRDADLCTQAELPAIGKARAGVNVDGRGVDLAQEALLRLRILGHNGLGVARAVAVDVRDGLIETGDGLDAHLERQILAAPVLLGSIGKVALEHLRRGGCARGGVPVDKHARGRKLIEHLGQELCGNRLVHQQRLGRVAHAHALGLGVHHDGACHVEIGGLVHVDMAVARARLDHRHQALAHAARDEAGAPARYEYVDDAAQAHKCARGRTVAGLDDAYGRTREARCLDGVCQHVRDRHAGALGQRAAAQDAGVARADADAGGVCRHVGARLVHHGHKAQRHAHLLQVEAAIDGAVLEHATHRVGQVGELLEAGRHGVDALGREQQAVQQAGSRPRLARGLHVLGVGGKDLVCMLAQGRCHLAHGRLARLVGGKAQRARGLLCRDGQLLDICGDVFHRYSFVRAND